MKKYGVWGIIGASVYLGDFEAESEEEAIEKAGETGCAPTICYQCAREVDLGDIYDYEADEIVDKSKE